MRLAVAFSTIVIALFSVGCGPTILGTADRGVYRLIEKRQRAALGATSEVDIHREDGPVDTNERMYRFTPRPVDADIPEPFQSPRPAVDAPVEEDAADEADPLDETPRTLTASIFTEEELGRLKTFGLREAVAYAMRRSRTLQSAKEDLYLAALDLTLERHLWTPQFVTSVQADYDDSDAGGLRDEERTFTAISDLAVAQRLPYGGEVTAQVIGTLVRDLHEHVSTGESGSAILAADIPLLRGAGRVAYESRYEAERELVYAVRTYERFRRDFFVDVAAQYFDLQRLKASIANTYQSYQSRNKDWEKAAFINRLGRSETVFDATRAKSTLRRAEADLVSAKERYQFALDQFKIFIGMPVERLLTVLDQDADDAASALDRLLPEIDESTATAVALQYRLDLLTAADAIDDAKRGVVIAKNRILPDLNFNASLAVHSDPEHLSATDLNIERRDWHAGLELRMDDRKTERNAYRASFVLLRRAERSYEDFVDTVKAEVRRAIRLIRQQTDLREIQTLNVKENEFRRAAAVASFDLGKSTNQDVVDADNDLLAARNDLADAVAAYRVAILNFRRDTGTLRFTHDGRLLTAPGEPSDNAEYDVRIP